MSNESAEEHEKSPPRPTLNPDGTDLPSQEGYNKFPERKGGKYKPTIAEIATARGGNEDIERFKCEGRVWNVAHSSPSVKLMLSALKASGCEVDLRRHISCEYCKAMVTGGYDTANNQIVICQNMCRDESKTSAVLTHELIHMFDYCRNKLDFNNIEHLACTEIRAANLTHCSYLSSVGQGDSSFINIADTHKACVKTKAVYSVFTVKPIPLEEARAVVDKVFDKCYKDLEPIGLIPRARSNDYTKAYHGRHNYGY